MIQCRKNNIFIFEQKNRMHFYKFCRYNMHEEVGDIHLYLSLFKLVCYHLDKTDAND